MIVLIDNYDSFTYNLYHYLLELGAQVEVHRNDKISVDEVLAKNPRGILISPGPSNPDNAGICLDLIKAAAGKIPIFGVCLGHQAIAQSFGGNIIKGTEPVHGKVFSMKHNDTHIFKGLKNPFDATRYHSLIVEKSSLPDCFDITCETEDGVIMGISHKEMNIHGVQFHPESIASEIGRDILASFLQQI